MPTFNVLDFPGPTDQLRFDQAEAAAVAAGGGDIFVPYRVIEGSTVEQQYVISQWIRIRNHDIRIIGDYPWPTLRWEGPDDGKAIIALDAKDNMPLYGSSVANLKFDGKNLNSNNRVKNCLRVNSVQQAHFGDIAAKGAKVSQVEISCDPDFNNGGTSECSFGMMYIDTQGTQAHGVHIMGSTFWNNGTMENNVHHNVFKGIISFMGSGECHTLLLESCDSNKFGYVKGGSWQGSTGNVLRCQIQWTGGFPRYNVIDTLVTSNMGFKADGAPIVDNYVMYNCSSNGGAGANNDHVYGGANDDGIKIVSGAWANA